MITEKPVIHDYASAFSAQPFFTVYYVFPVNYDDKSIAFLADMNKGRLLHSEMQELSKTNKVVNVTDIIIPYIVDISVEDSIHTPKEEAGKSGNGVKSNAAGFSTKTGQKGTFTISFNVAEIKEKSVFSRIPSDLTGITGTWGNDTFINPFLLFAVNDAIVYIFAGYKDLNGFRTGDGTGEMIRIRSVKGSFHRKYEKQMTFVVGKRRGEAGGSGAAKINLSYYKTPEPETAAGFLVDQNKHIFRGRLKASSVNGNNEGTITIMFNLVSEDLSEELTKTGTLASKGLGIAEKKEDKKEDRPEQKLGFIQGTRIGTEFRALNFIDYSNKESMQKLFSVIHDISDAMDRTMLIEILSWFLHDNSGMRTSAGDVSQVSRRFTKQTINGVRSVMHTTIEYLREVHRIDVKFDFSVIEKSLIRAVRHSNNFYESDDLDYKLYRNLYAALDAAIKTGNPDNRQHVLKEEPPLNKDLRIPYFTGMYVVTNGRSVMSYVEFIAHMYALALRTDTYTEVVSGVTWSVVVFRLSFAVPESMLMDHVKMLSDSRSGLIPSKKMTELDYDVPYFQYGVEVIDFNYSVDTSSAGIGTGGPQIVPVFEGADLVYYRLDFEAMEKAISEQKKATGTSALEAAVELVKQGAMEPVEFIKRYTRLADTAKFPKIQPVPPPAVGKGGIKLTLYLRWGIPGLRAGMFCNFGDTDPDEMVSKPDNGYLPKFIKGEYLIQKVEHSMNASDIYVMRLTCVK